MECKQDGKEVFYLVEANTFEQGVLWKKWNKKAEWKQHLAGNIRCVGYIGEIKEFPVYVSFSHTYINGKKVVFWYVSGLYADYGKVEDFLKQEFPECFNTMPHKNDDASNFPQCGTYNEGGRMTAQEIWQLWEFNIFVTVIAIQIGCVIGAYLEEWK